MLMHDTCVQDASVTDIFWYCYSVWSTYFWGVVFSNVLGLNKVNIFGYKVSLT